MNSRRSSSQHDNPSFARLKQTRLFEQLVESLSTRTGTLPGLGCFYGPAGLGKSFAALAYINNLRDKARKEDLPGAMPSWPVYVPLVSFSSKKSVLETIVRELGLRPGRTMLEMLAQVTDELRLSQRAIVVDEMDHLVERNAVEIIRDIYEISKTPIIMIGEEAFPRKLRRWERMHSRVLVWQAAELASRDDVNQLAPIYAPGIDLASDLKARILELSGGAVRRVCVNLERIRARCAEEGWKKIDLAAWGNTELYTGDAPPRRAQA